MAFRSALTKNDLISSATLALTAGQFVRVGERVIQAGEAVSLGFGEQSGQESAQGRIFMDLKDTAATPALIPGTIRLAVYSPKNRLIAIIAEFRSETLSTGAGDRTKQVPFPEDMYQVTEDRKIVLEFAADDAGKTLSKANSTINLDTTEEEN